jgi:hypothetical protein
MPQRLIDVPLESLPHIDEHSTYIAATPDRVWEALVETVHDAGGARVGPALAAVLGCLADSTNGAPGRIGSTIPGFVVTRSVAPAVLALMGEHRFSRYALIFCAAETASGPVRLSAETRAEFPGLKGRAYRTLVISTGGHVLVTKSVLRNVRRRAERG